mgnify:CR=1 FL=1
MKNFVISLQSATERREHINNEFGKHNVNFEFFDALTPDTAKIYVQKHDLPFQLAPMHLTSVEMACMMSHIAVWKKAIDENIPYITVFEDDIYLGINAEHFLNNSEWIKPDWNIIKIETVYNKVLLDNKTYHNLPKDRQLIPLKGKHLGAGAYTLSLQGVKDLFNYSLQREMLPIDETVFRDYILDNHKPVYQMVPALCVQDIITSKRGKGLLLPSSLEEDRSKRMRSAKKKGLEKIRREASRLVEQAKYSLYAEDIPFK